MSAASETSAWHAGSDELAWCIVGSGAATSIGLGFPASAAAARAGISRCRQHPFLLHEDFAHVTTAHAPYLPATMPARERAVQLCDRALSEALRYLTPAVRARGLRARTLLSTAPRAALEDAGDALHARLWAVLAERLADLNQGDAQVNDSGHAGGIRLLSQLADESADLVLLIGVDSYLDPGRVRALERAKLLRSEQNPWGMVPGEAAAVLLLMRPARARELGLPVLGRLVAAASALEPFPAEQGGVCTGQGLSWAFDNASARLFGEGALIDDVYCDLNGDPARVDELGFTLTRFSNRFREPGRFMSPANCWGDVGAASAPLLAQLALASWQSGWAAGDVAMVWTSSGTGSARAAMLLRRP